MARLKTEKTKLKLAPSSKIIPIIHSQPSTIDRLKLLANQQNAIGVLELLTGAVASDWKDLVLSTGRVAQAALKGKPIQQLMKEVWDYRKKGTIKDSVLESATGRTIFMELLDFLDRDIPDPDRVQVLKSIFLSTLSGNQSDIDRQAGYQLMKLARKLESMDVLVLRVCYEGFTKNDNELAAKNSFGDWISAVSKRTQIGLPALVGQSSDKLEQLGLLSDRIHSDKSGVRPGNQCRLTDLGVKFCEYMSRFP